MRISHHRPRSTKLARRRQAGAILVTSLLLLLTLTVIGVSVVQLTRMQERMTGNQRDLNLAFQGSEAGLRDGEALVADMTGTLVSNVCVAAPCDVFDRTILPVMTNTTPAWWAANSLEYGDDGAQDLDELDADPQFVVEYVGRAKFDLNVENGIEQGRDFFQITARSTGGSGVANTMLQTTFARVMD